MAFAVHQWRHGHLMMAIAFIAVAWLVAGAAIQAAKNGQKSALFLRVGSLSAGPEARYIGRAVTSRRFPPWSVEELDACFVVKDLSAQALAYGA